MISDRAINKPEETNLEKWHEDLNQQQLQLVKNIYYY